MQKENKTNPNTKQKMVGCEISGLNKLATVRRKSEGAGLDGWKPLWSLTLESRIKGGASHQSGENKVWVL